MAAHPPASLDTHAADAAAHGGEHAASGGFPPFDAATFGTQLFWFAITFGLLYVVVSRFVLPSVGGVLAKRAATISGDLEAAARESAAAEEARKASEAAVAKARADARATVEARRAEVMAQLGEEQARAEAAMVEQANAAEARIAATRAKALAEVESLARDLSASVVAKILPQKAIAAE